jgi:hypothetical protein
MLGFASQEARANGVKRAKHDAFGGLLIEHGFDALVHFPRSLIRECDCENLPRADSFGRDQIRDALSQYACLAGPRSCYDQNGSIGCDPLRCCGLGLSRKSMRERLVLSLSKE